MADELRINEKIAQYAKAFNNLPAEKHTVENAMKIFELLNTNNNNASKDILDDVDKIDDYFKDVMGLSVMNSISKDEFLENIDDWAGELAKYKAPEQKEEKKPTNILTPVRQSDVVGLVQGLNRIQPTGGNNWWGDMFGDDDDRAKDAFAMFGVGVDRDGNKPEKIIDETNIVEVFDMMDLASFRKSCNLLDDKDEVSMVKLVVSCFRDRIDLLENNGITVPDKVKEALDAVKIGNPGYWKAGDDETNFATELSTVIKGLRGLGVGDAKK